MEKPLPIKMDDLRTAIIEDINAAQIPAWVAEIVVKKIRKELRVEVEKELEMNRNFWEQNKGAGQDQNITE